MNRMVLVRQRGLSISGMDSGLSVLELTAIYYVRNRERMLLSEDAFSSIWTRLRHGVRRPPRCVRK